MEPKIYQPAKEILRELALKPKVVKAYYIYTYSIKTTGACGQSVR